MNHADFRKNESKKRINCWFCGRDLSQAHTIRHVDEGPICSICVNRHALNALTARNQNKDAPAGDKSTRAQSREGGLL